MHMYIRKRYKTCKPHIVSCSIQAAFYQSYLPKIYNSEESLRANSDSGF